MSAFINVSTNWLITLVSIFFESSYKMSTYLANIAGVTSGTHNFINYSTL